VGRGWVLRGTRVQHKHAEGPGKTDVRRGGGRRFEGYGQGRVAQVGMPGEIRYPAGQEVRADGEVKRRKALGFVVCVRVSDNEEGFWGEFEGSRFWSTWEVFSRGSPRPEASP